ncbi:uncharacterized protein QC764_0109740 [Podospora pseudoanserina]|uniref:Uncharacterized protein n=1 Tax=Podospora pseudoanserina TaxID=2609844 RepID=A0ABR0HI90_9PEZI|nr:hypothetical protein QC764_0109740 [Podospora pseudoanserina]
MKKGVYSAPASNNEQPNSIGGYGMDPISWDLPVKVDDPTGATTTVTGTIEEVIAQMEARYSGRNATFPVLIPTTSAHISAAAAAGDPESFTCDVPFTKASNNQILDGIHYLWGMSGTAKNGPGPGNCGCVSCSWWAAIYWCNDDDHEQEVRWKQIGNGAYYLRQHGCVTDNDLRIKGQAF